MSNLESIQLLYTEKELLIEIEHRARLVTHTSFLFIKYYKISYMVREELDRSETKGPDYSSRSQEFDSR